MAAWAIKAEGVAIAVGEGFDAVIAIIVIVEVAAGIVGLVVAAVAVAFGMIGV